MVLFSSINIIIHLQTSVLSFKTTIATLQKCFFYINQVLSWVFMSNCNIVELVNDGNGRKGPFGGPITHQYAINFVNTFNAKLFSWKCKKHTIYRA